VAVGRQRPDAVRRLTLDQAPFGDEADESSLDRYPDIYGIRG